MIKTLFFILFFSFSFSDEFDSSLDSIIINLDSNLNSYNRVVVSDMIIHGRRKSRTISSRNWSIGTDTSFTEHLSPAREKGVKMLKIKDKLWTYSPQTDRVIQISGHMLRQSMNGSDMSYKDMMETRPMRELYNLKLEGSEIIEGRDHWVIFMIAKVKGLSYPNRKSWIDKEYFLPIKEELYAKSGKLLKTTFMKDIRKVENRWFPFYYKYKDELKINSKGTEWIIKDVKFNVNINSARFSKSYLRK
ncbi:MAG: outer membrane lipoprotein-sorting protein [Candidatus Marinimicrobia bacterium]|nr:outer membrane lipoprotein-sorting protein [Candidatus Neomarinimicrobiota bacterium]|tara:strand:+ start:104 stop:844 length:741 start_codon:yes stop_codon:yes gene_type:complete